MVAAAEETTDLTNTSSQQHVVDGTGTTTTTANHPDGGNAEDEPAQQDEHHHPSGASSLPRPSASPPRSRSNNNNNDAVVDLLLVEEDQEKQDYCCEDDCDDDGDDDVLSPEELLLEAVASSAVRATAAANNNNDNNDNNDDNDDNHNREREGRQGSGGGSGKGTRKSALLEEGDAETAPGAFRARGTAAIRSEDEEDDEDAARMSDYENENDDEEQQRQQPLLSSLRKPDDSEDLDSSEPKQQQQQQQVPVVATLVTDTADGGDSPEVVQAELMEQDPAAAAASLKQGDDNNQASRRRCCWITVAVTVLVVVVAAVAAAVTVAVYDSDENPPPSPEERLGDEISRLRQNYDRVTHHVAYFRWQAPPHCEVEPAGRYGYGNDGGGAADVPLLHVACGTADRSDGNDAEIVLWETTHTLAAPGAGAGGLACDPSPNEPERARDCRALLHNNNSNSSNNASYYHIARVVFSCGTRSRDSYPNAGGNNGGDTPIRATARAGVGKQQGECQQVDSKSDSNTTNIALAVSMSRICPPSDSDSGDGSTSGTILSSSQTTCHGDSEPPESFRVNWLAPAGNYNDEGLACRRQTEACEWNGDDNNHEEGDELECHTDPLDSFFIADVAAAGGACPSSSLEEDWRPWEDRDFLASLPSETMIDAQLSGAS